MSALKKWFKNQVIALTMSMTNVEKNMLGQGGGSQLSEDVTAKHLRHMQGTLLDALMRGEVTQEVKDLRWRMYKVDQAASNMKAKFVRKNNEMVYMGTEEVSHEDLLSRIKVDTFDNYPLEMVVKNTEIALGVIETIYGAQMAQQYVSGDTVLNTATINGISSKDHGATVKGELPIKIERQFFPKFYLEKFTKKLVIRKIDDTKKLLEFYVNKYPDEYNTTSNFFVNEIKKVIENGPQNSNFLQFDEVGFVTNKTIGVGDSLLYTYNVLSFDKIIEFDGNYVIKFICEVSTNGEFILEQYVEAELEEKYNKKAARKRKI